MNPGNRPAGNVAGLHQTPGLLSPSAVSCSSAGPAAAILAGERTGGEPAHHPDENRARRGVGRKTPTANASDGTLDISSTSAIIDAEQHQPPGQLAVENPFDDVDISVAFGRRTSPLTLPVVLCPMHAVDAGVHCRKLNFVIFMNTLPGGIVVYLFV